jgi:hypothetical protein
MTSIARLAASISLACLGATAQAQRSAPSMPGMDMRPPTDLIATELQHLDSGTSVEPASTPVPMLMQQRGPWMLMLHGEAFVSDIQQQAANDRGRDRIFSTNWIMPMAMRKLGPGPLTLRAMFSFEPATVTGRYYPELFQQGETAYGHPIVDGQHPHNLFMEVSAAYDVHLTEHTLLSLYAAPVGDPSLGPTAYPHRLSASEGPIAALGHHQEDSTHVAFSVLTAGLTYKWLRLEGSGFHGAEPDESRWTFAASPNGHALDSYSGRITYSPAPNLSAQYSLGRLTAPEALHPTENQQRQTASVMYNLPFGAKQSMPGMAMPGDLRANGDWTTTLLYGHTRSLSDHSAQDSYLLESLLRFHTRNSVWTRLESASRTTELLNPAADLPLGHVLAATLGYDRDFAISPHLAIAPGAQFTVYRTPDALIPTYGRTPYGAIVFLRLRLTH